ncbi:MAG: phage-shock protein [Deltaproteobacteria bacterium]|nr:phage-shock protein [Deltaproteobacteria bacterium]
MQAAFFTAVVFGGISLALAVIGVTILLGIRLIKGGLLRKDRQNDAEDAGMIQEMYQKLNRMEERVDSLETILFDRSRGKTDHATD